MTLSTSRTRLDGPASTAVYQLEARDGDEVILRERLTVSLTTENPLSSLEMGEAAFLARAEQIKTNRAMMP